MSEPLSAEERAVLREIYGPHPECSTFSEVRLGARILDERDDLAERVKALEADLEIERQLSAGLMNGLAALRSKVRAARDAWSVAKSHPETLAKGGALAIRHAATCPVWGHMIAHEPIYDPARCDCGLVALRRALDALADDSPDVPPLCPTCKVPMREDCRAAYADDSSPGPADPEEATDEEFRAEMGRQFFARTEVDERIAALAAENERSIEAVRDFAERTGLDEVLARVDALIARLNAETHAGCVRREAAERVVRAWKTWRAQLGCDGECECYGKTSSGETWDPHLLSAHDEGELRDAIASLLPPSPEGGS